MHEDFRRAVESKDVNVAAMGDTLLPDVIHFLRAQAIWLIGGLVIGGVVGGGIALTKPKQWQASSVIQVGQVGNIDPAGQLSMIETIPNTVERITALVQQESKANVPGLGKVSAGDIDLLHATFSAQIVPNTGFIRMSVRGLSPDAAKITMKSAEDQLVAVHAKIAGPSIARLKEAQARVIASSAELYKRRAELQVQVQASAGKPASAQDVLLNSLIDKVGEEWRDLETRRLQLAEQLSDERTFVTRPIGEVVVSAQPVSPRISFYVAAGAIIGLAIAVLIGIFRHVGNSGRRR
ncbi:YveK family protein [Paraburkholderia sartisoli]|uniref:Chain length determinant protein n=1 Tax=Paraburkholderia sartisoli TaxID=83784 RepID=A0A1H4CR47_9BURK|nr:hypothetical protein [Paraburkholderia sartisoli]SEA62592.1 hypothetical protein SAMN05192564_102425 [Paraburkholderia sartisoli]